MTKWLILFFALLTTASIATAKLADPKDAEFRIDYENTRIHINKNGSYTADNEIQLTVLKESAREPLSTRQIYYNFDSAKVKVMSASVVNDGKSQFVSRANIEDKAAANSRNGFSSIHQVTIAFPNVVVGTKVRYFYSETVKEPAYPGAFDQVLIYGMPEYEMGGKVEVYSPIPLYFTANDPDNNLSISQTKTGGLNKLTVKLIKPAYHKVIEETASIVNFDSIPSVEVTTQKTWDEMSVKIGKVWDERLKEPLPEVYQGILAEAKTGKTKKEQIDLLLASLLAKLNYLGDWRTQSGRVVPRSLAEVAKNGAADCKDFTAAAVVLMRALGFTADPALVYRANSYEYLNVPKFKIPTLMAFNHAIVRANVEGKDYWIDPTNKIMGLGTVFSDISDRPALVIGKKENALQEIKSVQDSIVEVTKDINFSSGGNAEVAGSVKFTGVSAASIKQVGFLVEKKTMDRLILELAGEEYQGNWSLVDDYVFKDHRVEDLEFKFKMTLSPSETKEKEKVYYVLEDRMGPAIYFNKDFRTTGVYLNEPGQVIRKRILHNIVIEKPEENECLLLSPWVDASRKIEVKNGSSTIVDKLIVKKSYISLKEIKALDFEVLQSTMARCFSEFKVSLKDLTIDPKGANKKVAAADPEENVQDLIDSARSSRSKMYRAYDVIMKKTNGNPTDATSLRQLAVVIPQFGYLSNDDFGSDYLKAALNYAKQAVSADPKDTEAQSTLAEAYYFMGDRAQAQKELEKSQQLDPQNVRVEKLYGFIARKEKKYSEAISHFAKAMKYSKTDLKRAFYYQKMADVYLDAGQIGYADECYKNSIKFAQDDAWMHHNYAIFLDAQKRFDEAAIESEKSLAIHSFGAGETLLSDIYFQQGWILIQTSADHKKAADIFRRAIQHDPRNASAYYGLANVYFDMHMEIRSDKTLVDKMRENLIHALEISPNFTEARAMLNRSLAAGPEPRIPAGYVQMQQASVHGQTDSIQPLNIKQKTNP